MLAILCVIKLIALLNHRIVSRHKYWSLSLQHLHYALEIICTR